LDEPDMALDGSNNVADALPRIAWELFEVDDMGNVGRRIGGLHESVLETDPTGREKRPDRSD
jgi:hypothetical protein